MRRTKTRSGGASDVVVGLASVVGLTLAGFLAGRDHAGRDGEPWTGDEPAPGGWSDDGKAAGADASSGTQASPLADNRGRSARRPQDVPAKGWMDVLWRTYEEFSSDRLMLVAAGVTFYVLLALFPAITAMISIYGLFTDASNIGDQIATLRGVLPSGALDIISEQMARVASHGDEKLGFGLVFGLGVALWSANAGMKTLFDAMNIVYEEEEKRGFVKLTLVTLAFTLGTIVFLILALAGVVLLPIVLDFIGLGSIESWLLFLRWPVLLLVVAFGLSLVYRTGPSRRTARWRWISPGAGVAALLWVVFSILFSWYVQNFGNYDETYGSLGAAIGFMTWIWISTIVVLLGAELNAELEHQTAEDTTRSPERPLGQRGARMADTLGETKG
ncbi:YihY/virulence factor BrkB family protein [Aureimonas pseudogalii]|uniref:Membrane protein n=1 Tax=Aureimonas pseudogalii TaxID=1744844 RepID=A0A7W6H3F4_9HYPH|nr:YihY/virulence factor BrkB family protein [Aureimonas pseudogalii]MBB3996828.1 membrane protein [Aureimonas pseudogalii]